MAMDVEKEFSGERKPDTSFLKPKRTKKRDDIQSPFGNYNNAVLDKQNESVPEKKATSKQKSKPKELNLTIETARELSIIKNHGHIKCLYYLLLEKNCTDNLISRSHSELAHILAIDKSSIRKVLSDLINKKLLVKVKDSDPKTKEPATYRLSKIL